MALPLTILVFTLALAGPAGIANGSETEKHNEAPVPGPCNDKPSSAIWLDRIQTGLSRATCRAAAQFDGLFGNERFDTEYQSTHGRLAVGAISSERDPLRGVARFRLQVRLPQLSERFGAFIGQDEADDSTAGSREDLGALRRQFGLEQDDVLIGLGYRQPAFGGGFFDTSVGAHLGSGFDPYVRGRYRLALPFLERDVLRLGESLFWQSDLGVGVTSRFDVDRLLTEKFLARWTGSATLATHTQGVRWYSGATLYQSLGSGRALAYQLDASGESRAAVGISDYGLQIVFRRRTLRDWLFLELSSGISWPRDSLLESRERNLACGVALEMWFGETSSRGG